jgi:hypothetical protein
MSLLSSFDAFHEQAAQLTGLSDFGLTDYVEPMKLLLSDLDKYCPHTEAGLQFTQGALVGSLISRLLAAKGFKDNPEFANAGIEKPLIITGMPRTGSTSLQKLLAKDPNSQWLPPWLGGAPMPRPPEDTWESNPFFQATKQGLEHIYQAIPEVLAMHPMKAGEADECRYAIGSAFWSPDIAFTGPMSGDYAHWLTSEKPLYAYRYYRKLLGLIAGGDKRQWILKDPTTHPFAPETMLEVFPDARIVYTHRDPASAMSSVSNMLYYVRGLRVSGLKPEENGRDQLAFWSPAIERLEACLSSTPRGLSTCILVS